MKFFLSSQFFPLWVAGVFLLSMPSAHAAEHVTSVVALGNSITRHGPAPQIKWFGDWGMAASSADNDYAGRLRTLLKSSGQSAPNTQRFNVAVMEREPKGFKLDAATSAIASASGILVIELGDNAHADALQDFDAAYHALLIQTKQKKGVLLCLSTWWNSAKVDSIIKAACAKAGGTFVEIGDIQSDPSTHPSKASGFEDSGLLRHPGDAGMAEIAKRLFTAYTHQSKS
jgi:hypothetical protein